MTVWEDVRASVKITAAWMRRDWPFFACTYLGLFLIVSVLHFVLGWPW